MADSKTGPLGAKDLSPDRPYGGVLPVPGMGQQRPAGDAPQPAPGKGK
jgi:hypothetical protein